MFDIGWTEMLVIAIVLIVVVGPKDLPNMLRTFGRTTAKLRSMAADFQKQFNEALKEADLDDVKKSVDSLRGLNPAAEIRKQLNPFEQAAADVRSGVDAAMKPKPAADPAQPAASTPQAAEPLKNGATVLPGADAPEAASTFPVMTDASVTAPAKGSAPRKSGKPATPRAAKASAPAAKLAPAKNLAKVAPVAKATGAVRANGVAKEALSPKTAAKQGPAAAKPARVASKPSAAAPKTPAATKKTVGK